jgi:hypothetical protein
MMVGPTTRDSSFLTQAKTWSKKILKQSKRMAKAKPKPKSPFAGRWRIVSMSAWDEEFIDEEEEGYFEFDEKASGSFHFGYVHRTLTATDHKGRRACDRVDLGRQRRDGPGVGPTLGRGEGRGTARHDLLPRRRRFRVRGEEGWSEVKNGKTVMARWLLRLFLDFPVRRLSIPRHMSPQNRLMKRGRFPDSACINAVLEKHDERASPESADGHRTVPTL